jgi:serine/threonine protein kinase
MIPQPGPTPEAQTQGQTLGKYRITKRLGIGGMGVVYLGYDSVLHRSVAVKMLNPGSDSATVERFLREARAAARLSHANVVAIHDVCTHAQTAYLVMEYCPGGSVQDLITNKGPLSWSDAVRIVIQAGKGLAAAHDADLIHRDVKPANLLLSADGTVKVGDFGLVKILDANTKDRSTASNVVGTPDFMSPEQCQGKDLDERSDVYSLGATLFTLLTGQPLYTAQNTYGLLYAHCSEPIPSLKERAPQTPDALVAVVNQALAKSRTDRYSSISEFVDDLQRLNDATQEQRPVPPPLPKSKVRSRNWTRKLVVLAIAAAVGLLILWRTSGQKQPVEPPPTETAKLLPLDQRIEACRAAFLKANSQFDGTFGVVRHAANRIDIRLTGKQVKDLSALTLLPEIEGFSYICNYTGQQWNAGLLSNVEPLGGLPLKRLTLRHCQVRDIEALHRLKIEELDITGTEVQSWDALDVSQLKKARLDSARPHTFRWQTAKQLQDVYIIGAWEMEHLDAFAGLPLEKFTIHGARLININGLKGAPLVQFSCTENEKRRFDLSPLASTLRELKLDYMPNQSELSRFTALRMLNTQNYPPRP